MGHIRQLFLARVKQNNGRGLSVRVTAIVVLLLCGAAAVSHVAYSAAHTNGQMLAQVSPTTDTLTARAPMRSMLTANDPTTHRAVVSPGLFVRAAATPSDKLGLDTLEHRAAHTLKGAEALVADRDPYSVFAGQSSQSLLFLVADNPPYLRLAFGELHGRLGARLNTIFHALPTPVHYEAVPVRRALRTLLQNEEYACSIGLHKAEGEDLVQFTQELYPSKPLVLMTTAEKADKFLGYESFIDVFVSGDFVMSRSVSISYGPELDALVRAYPTKSIMATGGLEEQLNLVERDRSDYVLVTKEEFDYLASAGRQARRAAPRSQIGARLLPVPSEQPGGGGRPAHSVQAAHFQTASATAPSSEDMGDLRGPSHENGDHTYSQTAIQAANQSMLGQQTVGSTGPYVAISYSDLPHNLPIYMACSKQVPQDIIEAINSRINALNGFQE